MNQLQIFSELRKKFPNLLFFISRESDFKIVVYTMNREGMYLADNVCSHHMIDFEKPDTVPVPLSNVLIDNFYGFKGKPIPSGTNTYEVRLLVFPDRPLQLKLKKDRALISGTITGLPNVVILGVHLKISWGLIFPSMETITISGLDPKSKQIVNEEITVTSEMTKNYDLKTILTAYVSGQ